MSSQSTALRSNGVECLPAYPAGPATTGAHANAIEAPDPALEISVVSTRADFAALEADWDALFERAANGSHAFQSFGWCAHWCNHYLARDSRGQRLAIVTARYNGRLVLVWPLVAERLTGGITVLTTLGDPVSQYSDALVEPSPDAARWLRQAWQTANAVLHPDLLWMPRVREDAVLTPLLKQIGAIPTQRLEAPYIDLRAIADPEAFMQRFSSHSRKKFRAAARRLASVAPVVYETLDGGPAAGVVAPAIIDMKRRQLIERAVPSAAFADTRLDAFFADVARSSNHSCRANVFTLRNGADLAAANIIVACKDRMLGHVFVFDTRFAKDNAGSLLLHEMVKQAATMNYATFDLLAPADEYKLRCADGTHPVTSWALPLSARGTIFTHAYLRLARPLLKRAVEALPQRLRHSLARWFYRRAS